MSDAFLTQTACALGRAISAGTLDPVDLTEAFLEAIAASPFRDRIFTVLTSDRAIASAHSARQRARNGVRRSLFDGLPISWKDLVDVSGTPTRGGSTLTPATPVETDAAILGPAEAAGLVTIGKTHQTELAFSGLGLNPVTATPPNKHDPDLVPGGSSSGAAASVAYGLVPIAIGSDTGGSVRLPAAWNDLVGFKPTCGALPMQGCLPLAPGFDTLGPLARSVEDASEVYALLRRETAPDLRGLSIAGCRIGVLRGENVEGVDVDTQTSFENTVARLVRAGAWAHDTRIKEIDRVLGLAPVLYGAETWAHWGRLIETDPDAMHPPVRDRFRAGRTVEDADFVAAKATLARARADAVRATAGFDVVALPTCPILPPKVRDLADDHGFFTEKNLLSLRNTRIGNLLGFTAISLPTGTPSCGLMLMSPPGSEWRLLRIAAAVESALA